VLLGGTLGDLEAILGEDGVAGVGASTDLAAVKAMTENLVACQKMTCPTGTLRTLASLLPCAS
jgi:hypothetical protein